LVRIAWGERKSLKALPLLRSLVLKRTIQVWKNTPWKLKKSVNAPSSKGKSITERERGLGRKRNLGVSAGTNY